LTGCTDNTSATDTPSSNSSNDTAAVVTNVDSTSSDAVIKTVNTASGGILDTTDLFTTRDLTQTADLTGATSYTVSDGQEIRITAEGVYVLSGSAQNVTVYVEAGDSDKVQIVLNGVSITNSDFPCIYVTSADKVFVTTAADSSLSVTGTFRADGSTNTDGVIFSRSDLTLNGTATLTISSTDNGVVSKDDLKITGGTYAVTASSKAFEANDSINIADGSFTVQAGTDGFHVENDDATSYLYICGGTFTIKAGDDALHATAVVQIDGGTLDITAAEGIEATYIQINGGTITISASDDGINAAQKSSSYRPTFELNNGTVTITMGAGDTDGVDSNGDIVINGGTLDVTGNSTFDYENSGTINGGTVIINGEQVDTLPNQMMGGGMGGFGGGNMGGMGGNMAGMGGNMAGMGAPRG
ncbi:MAG: carbohydrate-binding domain-containing protein, partial [Clostridia bacterium]|nr:carbohydrate-binding domain-containing protein [Clostridia bacterium]